MDNVTARVTGLDDLMKALSNLGTIVTGDKEIDAALQKEAESLADEVRARAPYGSEGRLKKSITGKLLRRRRKYNRSAITAIDFRIFGHAYHVEYGHGGPQPAPAHPFFRPAVRAFKFGRYFDPVIRKRVQETWNKK